MIIRVCHERLLLVFLVHVLALQGLALDRVSMRSLGRSLARQGSYLDAVQIVGVVVGDTAIILR